MRRITNIVNNLPHARSWLFSKNSLGVFGGALVLFAGGGVARTVSVASIPILTRIYDAADFGVLAVFSSLILLLSPLITLKYGMAVPLPRRDATAVNLFVMSFSLMLLLGLVVSLLLWSLGDLIFSVLSMEGLAPWWWLIAIGVIAAATYELLTAWATRARAYKVIAYTQIWQSSLGSAAKIGLGFLGFHPAGLLIGQVAANSGGSGTMLRKFMGDIRAKLRHVRLSRMRIIAWRYRGFPIYRVPSHALLVASMQTPVLFIAALYDASNAGQFSLAMMALTLPVSLLGQSTAKAFYAEASRLGSRRPRAVEAMLREVLGKLALVAMVPTIVLLGFGEPLFRLVFGTEWSLAGIFAQALAVYLFFQFLQTPVSHVFYIFDGQRALLMLNAQRLVLVAGVFWLAYQFEWEASFVVWIYATTLAIHYVLSIIYALRFIPKETMA